MRKRLYFGLILVIMAGLLSGCASGGSDGNRPSEKDDAISSTSPTATLAPPTLTPLPQPTPTPTQTMTPTLIPTATPYVYNPDGTAISAENYGELEKYQTLGKGSIQLISTSGDRQEYLVQTTRGLFLYDVDKQEEIGFYENYGGFSLLPGGSSFAVVTPDLTIEIIDFESGEIQQTIDIESPVAIGKISFSKDGSLMGVSVTQPHNTRVDFNSHRIDVFDVQNHTLVARLESDVLGYCSRIEFSEDHTQVLTSCPPSGGGHNWIVNWDLQEQSIIWSIANAGSFLQYPFSPDGAYISTSTATETVIRLASNGQEVNRVPGKLSANAFSADNHYFVTSSFELIRVWYVTNPQAVEKLPSGLNWPEASYSDDGEYILANGGEKAWRVSDYELDESYPVPGPADPEVNPSRMREIGHLDAIRGVELQLDGTLLVWGYSEYEFLWWWYPEQDIYHEVSIVEGIGVPSMSPFNDRIAIRTSEGLAIVDLESENVDIVDISRKRFSNLAFSADAKTIFTNSGTVIDQIDLETGESLRQLRGHSYDIGRLILSDDGKLLFSISAVPTGSGYEAAVWGLDPYTLIRKWTIPAASGLLDAYFSVDGEELIAIADEITVWRVSDGWYLANLPGSSMALSPDGELAAIGRSDLGFAFYDTSDWSLIGPEVSETGASPSGMPVEYYNYFLYYDTKLAKFLDEGRELVSINSSDVIELWRIP